MSNITVLLLGENSIHDFDEKAPHIERALGDDAEVTVSTDISALESLAEYDVVVDYLTDSRLSSAAVDGLRSFVADGGGYLPIHCAADLTSYIDDDGEFTSRETPHPELRELVGGHFVSHPEISTFTVTMTDSTHPVVDALDDFDVLDEPYQVDVDEDRVRVLARMDHPDLDEHYPVVWVHEYGNGRICYSSLGHTDEALDHESHHELLTNAVRWVAGA
ncbi:ThuA domain-containing protein [Haloarchaeobius sp. DFWS5]|uniref:ThuA domain-containing protein n=1 Tax=Haloarchaeobius sp. DFWS5 TaxID=3446114 RepID=UPI003EBF6339